MKRKEFIKGMFLAGVAVHISPLNLLASNPNNFTPSQLTGKGGLDLIGDNQQLLQRDVWNAFLKMKKAAMKDKINIQVVSGFRSYDRQKQIYESKYASYTQQGLTPTQSIAKIIEYSTIPGTSRHHWGTDMDIIDANQPQPTSVLEEENYHGNGVYTKMKKWLDEHSESFGFYEVYTNKEDRKGFNYEPWHFSYKPISVLMLEEFLCLDFEEIIGNEKLSGQTVLSNEFIEAYYQENILDINPKLLP